MVEKILILACHIAVPLLTCVMLKHVLVFDYGFIIQNTTEWIPNRFDDKKFCRGFYKICVLFPALFLVYSLD